MMTTPNTPEKKPSQPIRRHFVHFYSPGTFFNEETTKEIDSWDIEKACYTAHGITERYGATPYGFSFSTSERGPQDWEPHEIARSGIYYLGGCILTLEFIKGRNDPNDRILISNMEGNGWSRVIENRNSWKCVRPFAKDDVLLDWKPREKS